MTHPHPRHLYRLKDYVRACRGCLCEFCKFRQGTQLHHRTYERFGRERHADVMLVCDHCHELIHRKNAGIFVRRGSLADRGDTGRGMCQVWISYLNTAQHSRLAA